MLRGFIRANRRICAAIERRLPQRKLDISLLYERTVGEKMKDLPAGSIIVDRWRTALPLRRVQAKGPPHHRG